uniref:Uncharacterized protein n=1 Tax=Anguilla anguilla TaxID=7936 RepID=A0A0E9VVR2_ANGAN
MRCLKLYLSQLEIKENDLWI